MEERSMTIRPYGVTRNGEAVEEITLQNGAMEAKIITLGATITALRVPDESRTDVVLGYSCLAGYEENEGYLGALVGRYANRIAQSEATIDGQVYRLTANEGRNQLHGGPVGFSHRVFRAQQTGKAQVTLEYTSPDGENGFPGTLRLTAIYTLLADGLRLRYRATCDRATFCNITNHSYFNLNGGGSVLRHRLLLNADSFTPVDAERIPLGQLLPVAGTPFDFTKEKELGRDIGADNEQLRIGGGYDHNFVLRPAEGLRPAAVLTGERSGIRMRVLTTKPGVQLYSANFLNTAHCTKSGLPYEKHAAVCLETQYFPDSPHHPQWGGALLRPGRTYDHTTELRFDMCRSL